MAEEEKGGQDHAVEKKSRDVYSRGELASFDWIAVGLVGLMAAGMLVAPAVVTPYYRSMYEEFVTKLDQLPSVTIFVMSTWFPMVSALFPLGLLVVALSGKRHLYLRRFLIVGAFFIGLAFAGLYSLGLYAPIFAIANAVTA